MSSLSSEFYVHRLQGKIQRMQSESDVLGSLKFDSGFSPVKMIKTGKHLNAQNSSKQLIPIVADIED